MGAARADVELPRPDVATPITIDARQAWRSTDGAYPVWRLEGDVRLTQGANHYRGGEAIVWVEQPQRWDQPTKLIVYLESAGEGPVRLESSAGDSDPAAPPASRQEAPDWFGRLWSTGGVQWSTPPPGEVSLAESDLFRRARARLHATGPDTTGPDTAEPDAAELARRADPAVTPAQFAGDPFAAVAPAPAPAAPQPSFRTIELDARQGTGLQAERLTSPISGDTAIVLKGGARLVITGVEAPGLPGAVGPLDRVELETDRAVIWSGGGFGLAPGVASTQAGDTPLEIYLEGNIVFRQGERVIYAERMFYDARRKTGVVLDAELLTPLPRIDGLEYRGLVRLKAGALRQLEDSRYVADDALLTTSRLEEPTYSLRSDRITFEDFQRPVVDPVTGRQAVNPYTGAPVFAREQSAAAEGNRVELGGVPVLYWPRLETDLEEPSYYIEDFRLRNDAIFGFQVLTEFDVHQLLGSKAPKGVDWTAGLDYLSERGLGYGTSYDYVVDSFAGARGPAIGAADLWFISENGLDNLGFGRRDIVPEEKFRGRAFWDHRQDILDGVFAGWTSQAQVGWISDRTFLEQYFEQEWDESAEQPTGLRLRRRIGVQSLSVEANAQVNEFFTVTQWLPRLDHWVMGQDLAGRRLTWFTHSHVGYANLNTATTPTSPQLASQFFLFPWEERVEGERAATRQEIDLPIDLEPYGVPAKVVPFFLGEVAHWGDALTGDDLQRAYLHTGVRASAPFWAVNPNVRDRLFNLEGLAHKVVFDAEVSYSDVSEDLNDLPLYDPLEDNALEEIRRRIFFPTIPATQDPRFYLVRTGMQGWVAAPTTEIAEDLTVARVGMRHRLQTKRGAPGAQRVVDWLTFDTNASLFPEEDRDNFGEPIGLVDYDMSWHLGDRFTVLSDGFVDVFNDGLRTFSAGVSLNRPAKGNLYVGYRAIRGPATSDLLSLRLNYRFGPKWVGSASTVVDFGEAGNIGQNFAISRIGESLLWTLGLSVDESKDNVGVSFLLEPRFLPLTNLSKRTGIDIPPAGLYGPE
ncbi:organic solvent tolerance protein OstA [Botrimarina sp.]|uniref:organic solvent tolerance protein OstA n=1 Tax=Botrimarina sp. TaxID=2795802 RepID=UPI0032EF8A3D